MGDISAIATIKKKITATAIITTVIVATATLPGTAFTPGFSNIKEISFPGIDEFIEIDGALNPLGNTTVGTWSCVITPTDATPSTNLSIMGFGDLDAANRLQFEHLSNGGFRFRAQTPPGSQWAVDTSSAVFSDGVRTHVAGVFDGVEAKIYVDSVFVAQFFPVSVDKTVWFDNVNLQALDLGRIGSMSFNNSGETQFFKGRIDEVRFWSIDLSATEIITHYNSGTSLQPSLEPQAGFLTPIYRMGDGDTFPTITDGAGFNDGTMTNMVAGDIVNI